MRGFIKTFRDFRGNGAVTLPERGFAVLRRFRREEDGSLIIFGLFTFLIMLLAAGAAIDFMRFETERTNLQNTMDRALLAAADLEQQIPPQDVVKDYFKKAGMEKVKLTFPAGVSQRGLKKVNARADLTMGTMFLTTMSMPTLGTPVAGGAMEGSGDVEISLVVDVSGSMAWCLDGRTTCASNSTPGDTRIEALRAAAGVFVESVFQAAWKKIPDPTSSATPKPQIDFLESGVEPQQISVNLIPYAQQANMGPVLGPRFTFTNEHNVSWCADFAASDFASTTIDPAVSLNRSLDADARYSNSAPSFIECAKDEWRYAIPFSNEPNVLYNAVQALQASGATSVDIGAKWGAALLDPKANPVVTQLIAQNKVHSSLSARPEPFRIGLTQKILVLMTDGENTQTYTTNSPYRGAAPASIVKGQNGYIYVYYPERSGTTDWYGRTASSSSLGWRSLSDIGGSYTSTTYSEVYKQYSIRYFLDTVYPTAMGGGSKSGTAITPWETAAKDVNLDAICTAAKNEGIEVWTIALGLTGADMSTAPRSAWSPLQKCASLPAMYFQPKTSEELRDAFEEIAAEVRELRLTQ